MYVCGFYVYVSLAFFKDHNVQCVLFGLQYHLIHTWNYWMDKMEIVSHHSADWSELCEFLIDDVENSLIGLQIFAHQTYSKHIGFVYKSSLRPPITQSLRMHEKSSFWMKTQMISSASCLTFELRLRVRLNTLEHICSAMRDKAETKKKIARVKFQAINAEMWITN